MIKEYERGATTMLNAYLSGTTDRSISALEERLPATACGGPARHAVLGRGDVDREGEGTREQARRVRAGRRRGRRRALGQVLGFPNVITTDVGGTSFDVGLVVDGEPLVNARPVFGKYHTVLPVTDVASIGAGGGSIAWIERAHRAAESRPAERRRRARARLLRRPAASSRRSPMRTWSSGE